MSQGLQQHHGQVQHQAQLPCAAQVPTCCLARSWCIALASACLSPVLCFLPPALVALLCGRLLSSCLAQRWHFFASFLLTCCCSPNAHHLLSRRCGLLCPQRAHLPLLLLPTHCSCPVPPRSACCFACMHRPCPPCPSVCCFHPETTKGRDNTAVLAYNLL